MPRRKPKEIIVTVQVESGLSNAAYRILSNALSQFKYRYARIEIKDPLITEESSTGLH